MAGVSRAATTFTPKQGQYLAYMTEVISLAAGWAATRAHLHTRLHRRPPAETDMQQYFRVSPPSVHQIVLTLPRIRPVKITAQRHYV
jgi:hypothetical protein